MKLSENIRYMANHLSEVDSDYLNDIAASVENMEVEIPELPGDFATLRDQLAMTALQGLMPLWKSSGYTYKSTSVEAYKIADVMLEARK